MAVRVLLLEDERSVRRAFSLLLEEAGHEVCATGTVEEALAQLLSQVFDVAVIDIVMASNGGPRLLQTLRAHHPDVAIVAITGNPTVFAELAGDRDLDERLVKPVTRDGLLAAIGRAQSHRLLRRSQTRVISTGRALSNRRSRALG